MGRIRDVLVNLKSSYTVTRKCKNCQVQSILDVPKGTLDKNFKGKCKNCGCEI